MSQLYLLIIFLDTNFKENFLYYFNGYKNFIKIVNKATIAISFFDIKRQDLIQILICQALFMVKNIINNNKINNQFLIIIIIPKMDSLLPILKICARMIIFSPLKIKI